MNFLAAFLMCKETNLLAILEASPQPSQRCMQGNFSHRLGRKHIPPVRSGLSSEIPELKNFADKESVPTKLLVFYFTAASNLP